MRLFVQISRLELELRDYQSRVLTILLYLRLIRLLLLVRIRPPLASNTPNRYYTSLSVCPKGLPEALVGRKREDSNLHPELTRNGLANRCSTIMLTLPICILSGIRTQLKLFLVEPVCHYLLLHSKPRDPSAYRTFLSGVSNGLEPILTESQSVVLTIALTNPFKKQS